MTKTLTATIRREDDGFVALCNELDIASEGETVEEARANLTEAVELFFETASPTEIEQRLTREIYITPLEVVVAETA
jgi:predicted RNase H-like HicB family nuclease